MTVEIEGVTLHLAHADEIPIRWVGQEEVMRQLLARSADWVQRTTLGSSSELIPRR
jgi:hypothetical protein